MSATEYVRDELTEALGTGDDGAWLTPDGTKVPFTKYKYHLRWEGYTEYYVEFAVWPKSLKIALIAVSSSPDAYDPYVSSAVMNLVKLTHQEFTTPEFWIDELTRVLDDRLQSELDQD